MRKIFQTLFALITLLISNLKLKKRSAAEPRFCETYSLRWKEAWERKPAIGFLTKLTLFALITLLISNSAHAEWIDKYFDAAMVTNPSAYQGQQSGYYTGGGFSARLSHKSDPLMNIQLPKIKAGCGGIDVFWGGVSFMNMDYLVKKAEGLLKNAPYVVFSLALKELSTKFGETIETAQAIVDQLNQLQLDECSATKSVFQYALKGETPSIVKEFTDLKTNTLKLGKGIAKHWGNSNKETDSKSTQSRDEMINATTSDPIAKELLTGDGTVLALLKDHNLITKDEEAAIRALVGDVEYVNSSYSVTQTKGCAGNITFAQYITDKTPFQENPRAPCKTNKNSIQERANEHVRILIAALTDDGSRKSKLNAATAEFISGSDIPIFAYLASGSIAGADYLNATFTTASTAVAAGYAYGSLNSLHRNITSVLKGLEANLTKQDNYVEAMVKNLNLFNKNIVEQLLMFQNEYSVIVARLNQSLQMAKHMEDINYNLYKIRQESIFSEGAKK